MFFRSEGMEGGKGEQRIEIRIDGISRSVPDAPIQTA